MYACGEATNGRLGLGISTGTVSVPRQITSLSQYVIKKVAVHSGIIITNNMYMYVINSVVTYSCYLYSKLLLK